jgi:Tol biopolymer transport system component
MTSKWALTFVLGIAGVGALAAPAAAVLSGENGRIVFASGRDADNDALAQLHLLPVPGSTGGGTVSAAITSFAAQHRHPTWSPDRTMIAYARGNPMGADFDIYVQDLTNPGSTPVNITNSPNATDDRPAWSPDGTKIAYESEVSDASNQMDVVIQNAPNGGGFVNFTNTTTAGQFEGKPAWTPDSGTLFYQKGDPMAATNVNIVKRPVAGGTETLAVSDSMISEFQPSISPDGTKVCFTLSNNGFNNTADVLVAPITDPPSGGVVVSKDATLGDYNCTFSPDVTLVAYVNGTFSTGQLVMVRADNTSLFAIPLAQDAGADNFDGNPDWAPDGRPICPDSTVTTTVNVPVTFQVDCTDTGPAYEQSDVREFSGTNPTNGTLTQNLAGDPFTYTPNQGFIGTDSFQVRSFDELGFGTDVGTVTINVNPAPPPPPPPPAPLCGGRTATIVGTAGNDTLNGTAGIDVIAGLGGSDTIASGPGNDIICGGSGGDLIAGGTGNDRASAGTGADRVSGNRGNDRLTGGGGNDRLGGGSGRDRLVGNSGRDRLLGGPGPDRLSAGSGRDRLDGGGNQDICRGGPSRDTGRRCERSFGVEIFAAAGRYYVRR